MKIKSRNKWALLTALVALTTFATTNFAFADHVTYDEGLAISFVPCELAELAYIERAPVESLGADCLAEYTALVERDIDLGFTSSAVVTKDDRLLETLLASTTGHAASYVWTADLVEETEREIDAGFIPTNVAATAAVFEAEALAIDVAEWELDAGFHSASAGITFEVPSVSSYAYRVSLVGWSDEALAQLESEIDAGLFIR